MWSGTYKKRVLWERVERSIQNEGESERREVQEVHGKKPRIQGLRQVQKREGAESVFPVAVGIRVGRTKVLGVPTRSPRLVEVHCLQVRPAEGSIYVMATEQNEQE